MRRSIDRRGSNAVSMSQSNLYELANDALAAHKLQSSHASHNSRITHTTDMASHMSRLPTVSSSSLMQYAQEIFNARRLVCDFVSQSTKQTLRDTLSSTQIYQILKKNNVHIELQYLKALLKELGFKYNGPSTSLTLLFSACKAFIHGISGGYTDNNNLRSSCSISEFSSLSKSRAVGGSDNKKILAVLRDMIYTSNTSLYELFKVGAAGGALDFDGFAKVCETVSDGNMMKQDIQDAFKAITKNKNGKVSFQTFEETFKSEVPTSMEFETKVIRSVRQWMFNNHLSSEMAFDTLCRSAGRFVEKTMSRAAFHRACMNCEVGLSAA